MLTWSQNSPDRNLTKVNVGFAGKTNVIHRGPTLLKDLRMCANILFLDTTGHVQRLLRKIIVQFSVRHG